MGDVWTIKFFETIQITFVPGFQFTIVEGLVLENKISERSSDVLIISNFALLSVFTNHYIWIIRKFRSQTYLFFFGIGVEFSINLSCCVLFTFFAYYETSTISDVGSIKFTVFN